MILYRFMRLISRIAMWVFFSGIEVEGIENVPGSGPVILVPNHTNALVDGLIVGGYLRRPVTMTAKSTLSRNPLLRLLMRMTNVITFQRRQDASQDSDMDANLMAFAQAQACLEQGGAICLFPEGKSYSEGRVQKFKTGAARIALDYLNSDPEPDGLQLVPVGLYYQKKNVFRSRAWIGFGKSVDVRQWRLEHGDDGAAELTTLLENRVRELTVNFDDRSRLSLFRGAADLLATHGESPLELGLRPAPRLAEQVHLVHILQEGYERLRKSDPGPLERLEKRVERYRAELLRHAVAPHEVFLRMHAGRAAFFVLRELELLILGLPIFLWGLLNHILPSTLVYALAKLMTREEDQFASNAIFLSIVIFPLLYTLQVAFAALNLSAGWLLLYLISVPYSGAYAVCWLDRIRGTFRRTRTYLLWRFRNDLQQRLADEGRQIISEMHQFNERVEAEHGTPA